MTNPVEELGIPRLDMLTVKDLQMIFFILFLLTINLFSRQKSGLRCVEQFSISNIDATPNTSLLFD